MAASAGIMRSVIYLILLLQLAACGVEVVRAAPSGTVLLGVASDWVSFHGAVGEAIRNTWHESFSALGPDFRIVFFVGECHGNEPGLYNVYGVDMVCLNTADTYPPQEKVFKLWTYFFRQEIENYKWFAKVDQDSYINAFQFKRLLAALQPFEQRIQYIGRPFRGRAEEADVLGLGGHSYCSGIGYILSQPALRAIGPHLSTCRSNVKSNHSDTEMGRCVHAWAKVECRGIIPAHKIRPIYATRRNGEVSPMVLQEGRIRIGFTDAPSELDFRAALVHPLKQPAEIYLFHKQCVRRLRPIQAPLLTVYPPEYERIYRTAASELRITCVNNPARQVAQYGVPMLSCRAPSVAEEAHIPPAAHIMPSPRSYSQLSDEDSSSRLMALRATLARSIIRPFTHSKFKTLLENLADTVRLAQLRKEHRLFIIYDTAVLHCDFKNMLSKLLSDSFCGNHLFSASAGGVLLLNPTTPLEDQEETLVLNASPSVEMPLCMDPANDTLQPLGFILHRAVYDEVLDWISSLSDKESFESEDMVQMKREDAFNAIFTMLANHGYPVRTATTPLLSFRPYILTQGNSVITDNAQAPQTANFCLDSNAQVSWDLQNSVQ